MERTSNDNKEINIWKNSTSSQNKYQYIVEKIKHSDRFFKHGQERVFFIHFPSCTQYFAQEASFCVNF